jgi:peptide-methionine (S)-S-oxide reductase
MSSNWSRKERAPMTTGNKAILAGGCFWNLQEKLRDQEGVLSTRVGYAGGDTSNPTYDQPDGHAEAVEVEYDPERIDFRKVLEYFFNAHDPTTKDRQGKDVGRRYRSAICYLDDDQKRIALATIDKIDQSDQFRNKIVTEVTAVQQLWEAEPEHQDYLQK